MYYFSMTWILFIFFSTQPSELHSVLSKETLILDFLIGKIGRLIFGLVQYIQGVQPRRKPGRERGAGTTFLAYRCVNCR
jgi:hypothetical protein